MLAKNLNFSVLLLWCSVLAGCPSSDDILLGPDALFRQDIIVDIGQRRAQDTSIESDNGQPEDINSPDTSGGCLTVDDCAALAVGACEVPACIEGECVAEEKPNDAPCDDGNPCTETACVGGVCIETNAVACPDDGNVCTAEVCNPESGCQSIPTNLPCDDGDPCTEGDKCFNSVCQGGTLACDVGTKENPGASCAAVKDADPTAPNGVYWVTLNNGTPAAVYCEMTLNGGGWVRVGLIAAEIAICNYTQGFGDQTQVIGSPTTTTVYPASTVAFLPEDGGDVLVSTAQGYAIFRSSSPSWNWAAIANGSINSVTLVDFGVELSVNGGPFEVLQSPGVNPPLNGPAMLGGITAGGQLSPFLGLGGSWTNTFEQNDGCLFYESNKGLYAGNVLPPATWNTPGQIFLR
jgi:hypothetical protein